MVGARGREFQHQCGECGVTPQWLKVRQVLYRTLAALASELKPIVLVNSRNALGLDAEGADQRQSLDQLWEIASRDCISGLPQPRDRTLSTSDSDLEQLVE